MDKHDAPIIAGKKPIKADLEAGKAYFWCHIKAISNLYYECRKTRFHVYKIEKYADVDRANELFTSKNHVNVSNSPYIIKGIAQLMIGVKSKKFITSSTDAFKQDMTG
jgi:hypothetical protein